MSPEEFRQAGHQLIDWIADYRAGLAGGPVRSSVQPGDIAASFPVDPPTEPTTIEHLLDQLDKVVVPGMTQVQHPMHFGWFPSNASLASVLGDIASSGLGGLGISWESCPPLTEVEEVVCDWMRTLTGLSSAWRGTIHDTASSACLVALLSARERATGFAQSGGGLSSVAEPPVVYATAQAHSSVHKAALLGGYGADHVRIVASDPATYAMDPTNLVELMAIDAANGLRPAAVVATVGTTGTTAIDPLPEIVVAAAAHRAWVHVDAAMAGTAMLLPECRPLWNGVEGADSLCWNPHKWMGTILDTSLYYVRDVEHLVRVMSTNPSYLQSSADGQVTQYRDWGLPLGRRFRALKLWFHLQLDGVEAIQHRLRRDLRNAKWLAAQVEETPGWELMAPVPLQTVCVRHRPSAEVGDSVLDAHTIAWCDRINASGEAYLTRARLDSQQSTGQSNAGSWMVRVSVGVEATDHAHVARLWDLMRREAEGTSQ